jgi:hypothetical protein
MAVNLPVQNFFRRANGPVSWTRPSDWPVITDTAGEVQYLMSDLGDSNCSLITAFSRTSGSQNLVIDWGDGTTDTISTTTNTTTNHTYTPGTGTPCSLGYTTFKIRVYFTGAGVSSITSINITPLYISGNTASVQACFVLEAYYGNGTSTSNVAPNFYGSAGTSTAPGFFTYLQYVKFPATVTWTSMSNIFSGCSRLAKVIMPTSGSSLTSFQNTFQNCFELEEIIFPSNAINISTLSGAFNNCTNLKTVTFPTSLNACISLNNSFQNAVNVRYLDFPPLGACTGFTSAFSACTQLEWIKFRGLYANTNFVAISFSSAFNSCPTLQNIYLPNSVVSNTPTYDFTGAFTSCTQLKSIVFPSNMNINTLATAFSSCSSLASCVLPSTMPSCLSMSSTFSNCFSLQSVTLPTTAASGLDLSSAFASCFKLEKITIPSTLIFGGMANAFQNCYVLKTLDWNPGVQNSITSMINTFLNCFSLETIPVPTSMTSLTSLSGTFNGCRSLKSIALPSTLNNVLTMAQTFANCNELISVTLPTSMSACTAFNSVFNSCRALVSVIFPNIVSTVTTTFNGAFQNCSSLKSITFPGAAQLSSITDIGGIFASCANLSTLINFDKIGSLTATPLMSMNSNGFCRLTSISIVAPLSLLTINGGTVASQRSDTQSVRLLNTSAGQWSGGTPQINVSYTNMSTANLIQLFNDMAAQGNVVSKTINITGATGAAGLTTTDRQIITTKGWTITG